MFFVMFKKDFFQNPLNYEKANDILSNAESLDNEMREYEDGELEEERKEIVMQLKEIGEYKLAQIYEEEENYDKFEYRVRKELGANNG